LMSGDGKRGDGLRPQATAPILDSTPADLILALAVLASALVANDWTVELTGLITSRGQRKPAPADARSGVALEPGGHHNFDSRQLVLFTILHL